MKDCVVYSYYSPVIIDISINECIFIDILILIFSVKITKRSYNYPEVNKGIAGTLRLPFVTPFYLFNLFKMIRSQHIVLTPFCLAKNEEDVAKLKET